MADDTEITEPTETKTPKSTLMQATSALKRARKSAGPEFNDNPAEVNFLLKQAEVLAMLAIAEGLNGAQAGETS